MGKFPNIFTPTGEVVGFNAIGNPYKDEYTFTVAFTEEEAQAVIDQVKAVDDRSSVKYPAKRLDDGRVGLRFKRKASTRKGDAWPLTVIDGAKNKMGENPSEGSKIKVKFSPYPTAYQGQDYCRFTPIAVQVLEFVAYSGDDSDGFDEEAGGFESTVSPSDLTPTVQPAAPDAPVQDPGDF